MQKRLLFDTRLLKVSISRLCQQLVEVHQDFSHTVLIGMQPRGIFLGNRIVAELEAMHRINVHYGRLDTTFHRDDFRRRGVPILPTQTNIPFPIENKQVVLIDDVLFTGRTVRAALDAMNTYGRPAKVELLILIDRLYSRELPIEATYIGQKVNTIQSQRVSVELSEQGKEDNIWLISTEE